MGPILSDYGVMDVF